MYIPVEMQVENRYVACQIPSNRSYFSRIGEVTALSSQYTGEELARINQDKITQIEDYQRYAEQMAFKSE